MKRLLQHCIIFSIIQSICDTCVDNCSGHFDSHSSDIGKSKKHKQTAVLGSVNDIRTARRCVAPSSTQVLQFYYLFLSKNHFYAYFLFLEYF